MGGVLSWGWRGWALVMSLVFLALLATSSVRLDGLPDVIVSECHRLGYGENEQCPSHAVAWAAIIALLDFLHTHQDSVNAFATAIIAIFTGTLFWSNIRLWRASDRSAEAAEKAIAASQRIGQAQVRAYLSCENFSVTVYPDYVWFYPIIKNSGQSPAETTRFSAYIDVSVPGSGKRNKSADSEGEGPFIAAGETGKMYIAWSKTDMNDEMLVQLKKGGASFEIFCRLYCTDVFGVERKTTFLVSVGKNWDTVGGKLKVYERGDIDHLTPGIYDD